MIHLIVPQAILYTVGKLLNLPTNPVLILTLLLNAIAVYQSCRALFGKVRSLPPENRIFEFGYWIALLLFIAIPGAYLEYPSDPYEHLYRIWSWNGQSTLNNPEFFNRFSYFLNWSLFFWIPNAKIFTTASIMSTLWQFMLAGQIYRFLRSFNFDRALAKVAVLGFFLTFGVSIFSIRYYALASTLVAMMAFFEALVLIRNNPISIWKLSGCLVLMFLNHTQELGFFAISAATFAMMKRVNFENIKVTLKIWIYLLFTCGVTLTLGYIIRQYFPFAYRPEDLNQISKFGTFVLWNPQLNFFQAFGLTGILGAFLSVIYFRRIPYLASLTLIPIVLLMFPPFASIYSLTLPPSAPAYRLFYMMPSVFMATFGIAQLARKWLPKQGIWLTLLFIICLGIPPKFPFYGKLKFHFHQPTPERKLEPMLEVAKKLEARWASLPPQCKIVADDTTDFFISTYLSKLRNGERLWARVPGFGLTQLSRFYDYAAKHPTVCGYLIGQGDKIVQGGESWVADTARHWSKSYDHRSVALASFPYSLVTYRNIFPSSWKEIQIDETFSTFVMPKREDDGMTWRIYGMSHPTDPTFMEVIHSDGINFLIMDLKRGAIDSFQIPIRADVPHDQTIILESDIAPALRDLILRRIYNQPSDDVIVRINKMRYASPAQRSYEMEKTLAEVFKESGFTRKGFQLKTFDFRDLLRDEQEKFGSIISLYKEDAFYTRFDALTKDLRHFQIIALSETLRAVSGIQVQGYGKKINLFSEFQKPLNWDFYKNFKDASRTNVAVFPRPEYLKNLKTNFLEGTEAEIFAVPYSEAIFNHFAPAELKMFAKREKSRFEFVDQGELLEFFVNSSGMTKTRIRDH